MTERTILASFRDPDKAQEVASKLKSLQIDTVQIDRISPYPGSGATARMSTLRGNIPSLGHITLDADFSSDSASILAAADTMASGMAGGIDPNIAEDILMTVVCDASMVEKAVRLIRDNGGTT